MSSLTQFTIYDKPADFPMGMVVREWIVSAAGPQPGRAWHVPTLERARALVPPGMYNLGRMPDDDPTIVETWT